MAKIVDYDENEHPDPETDFFVIAYGGQNYSIRCGNGNFHASRVHTAPLGTDLLGSQIAPFSTYTAAPAITQIASEADHPGIFQVGAGANFGGIGIEGISHNLDFTSFGSGGILSVYETCIRILDLGSEVEFCTRDPSAGFAGGGRFGMYYDTANLYGYINPIGMAVRFSITDSFSPVVNTWYKIRITYQYHQAPDGPDYLFEIFSGGNIVWSYLVSTNFIADLTTQGIFISSFLATGASMDIDYLAFRTYGAITR